MNHKAIYNTHSNVVSIDETVGAFDKDGNIVVLDQDKVDVETAKLKAEYDVQEYARNRVLEYPSNGDQWDMIYKDMKNNTTTHADAVEAVKAKYPKPE